jgi:hypothetical protein
VLIKNFVDPQAEFVFLPRDTDWAMIDNGIVFDVPNCELQRVRRFARRRAPLPNKGRSPDYLGGLETAAPCNLNSAVAF